MHVALVVLLFAIGVVLVIKGGDWFVDAATWLAEATGIPKFIVGATIVSFATTLPELLVSSFATWQGHFDMALGNAIGSVNCNTGIIMGLSTIFIGGAVSRKQFRNKGILFILACCAVLFLARDCAISAVESIILIIICVLFITDSIVQGRNSVKEVTEKKPIEKKALSKNILFFVAGAAAMAVGAKLMVDNGEELAHLLNVPDIIISITLVAIGTSLPELVTTITAIRKKQSDISIGNIIGANVMDMCLVAPVSAVIAAIRMGQPLTVDTSYRQFQIPIAIAFSLVAVVPTLIFKKTTKWQGILLLLMYVAYIVISLMFV